jgi:hypothetical protein
LSRRPKRVAQQFDPLTDRSGLTDRPPQIERALHRDHHVRRGFHERQQQLVGERTQRNGFESQSNSRLPVSASGRRCEDVADNLHRVQARLGQLAAVSITLLRLNASFEDSWGKFHAVRNVSSLSVNMPRYRRFLEHDDAENELWTRQMAAVLRGCPDAVAARC